MSTVPIPLEERLIVALDVPTVEEAERLIGRLGDQIRFYKIGLQLIYAGGLVLAERLAEQGVKIFLDGKLWDIGETVKNGVVNAARLGAAFLTVHGDRQTLRAALEGRGSGQTKILAVTALTSLDAADLADEGIDGNVEDYVLRRVRTALAVGADGVIASPQEIPAIRAVSGGRLLVVAPGIRLAGAGLDDQKRVATPKSAMAAGADHIVVGRPIVRADDPAAAAAAIIGQIREGLAGG